MLDLRFQPGAGDAARDGARACAPPPARCRVVRELEDDPVGYSPELWKQLAQLDLIGLLLPEEYGGSGMSALEGVVLYEELGRALAPSPHFVSAGALRRGPGPGRAPSGQQQEWLPGIVTGEAILTPAWLEPENGFGPTGRAGAGRARRGRLRPLGRQAPRGLRQGGHPAGGPGPDRRRPGRRRPLPGRPGRHGRDPDPAADHRLGHPVPGGPRPGPGRRRRPDRAAGQPGGRPGTR